MTQLLQDIFTLEDAEKFDEAFDAYNDIYNQNKNDYEVWKHFYFFLWTAIEDAPSSFHDKINLRHLMQVMFDEGKKTFADNADFNFIAGSIFWIRTSILKSFFGSHEPLRIRKSLEKGNVLDFEKGTNVHAWERLFSFLPNAYGFKIIGI